MQLTYIFALFFALVVTVFALLNAQPVAVDFIFKKFQVSLALVILASAFAGAMILGLLGVFHKIKESLRFREMYAKIKSLEGQLKETTEKLERTEAEFSEMEKSLLRQDNAAGNSPE